MLRKISACLAISFLLTSLAFAPRLTRADELSFPSQTLSDSLRALGNQTKTNMLFDPVTTGRVTAPAVDKALSVEQALRKLLVGSGLTFRFIDARTVTVISEDGRVKQAEAPPTAGVLPGGKEGEMKVAQAGTAGSNGTTDQKGGGDQQSGASSGEKLEEIVVTAQKRKERLIDVPMSVTAKSGDELAARGITNIQDLSYVVPSLSVYETSPAQQLISIRGISSTRGRSSLTGVYLDEMPLSGLQDNSFPAYPDLRVIDLDRVEVLKGPQGTLYGEGAAGGLIRFITKDPDLSRVGGDLSTEFSNTAKGGWSETVTGVLNLPLATDVFGIRVAAKYENIAGWIDQPSVGREDINDSEVKHVRVKALYAPTANMRIKGMAEIHRNDFGGTNIVNQLPLTDSNFVQAYDPAWPTDGHNDYDMFNLTVTYDFPFGELLSSTSYAKLESLQRITQVVYQPGQSTPWLEILSRNFRHDAPVRSQELRLTSSGTGPFHWTVGGNFKQPELTVDFGDGIGLSLFGGNSNIPASQAGVAGAQRVKNWAGFADVSYQFASHIEVGGGFRYSSYKEETWLPNVSPREVESITSSKPTYRGYIKYAFSPDANIYFNVGTGFRAGGHNGAEQVALGAPAEILPENTLSYELGTKMALLDHRLRLAGAAFYTKYQDMFANRLAFFNDNLVGYTANGQDAKVQGVEAEIDWAAMDRLTLTLAGDVTHTEITEVDPLAQNPQYVVGDPINFVPKYSVSASADYRFHWSGAVRGSFQLVINRKGEQHDSERGNGLIIDKQVVSPEINFLDASVGAEWNGWNWTLFGRNLLDEDGLISPSAFGLTAQARPRAIGVSVAKSF